MRSSESGSISDEMSDLSDENFSEDEYEFMPTAFFAINTRVNVGERCNETGKMKYVRGSVSGFDPYTSYYSIDYDDGMWGELDHQEIMESILIEDLEDAISFLNL
jgi:hypothetical protein